RGDRARRVLPRDLQGPHGRAAAGAHRRAPGHPAGPDSAADGRNPGRERDQAWHRPARVGRHREPYREARRRIRRSGRPGRWRGLPHTFRTWGRPGQHSLPAANGLRRLRNARASGQSWRRRDRDDPNTVSTRKRDAMKASAAFRTLTWKHWAWATVIAVLVSV